jgi:hypothetical protein
MNAERRVQNEELRVLAALRPSSKLILAGMIVSQLPAGGESR